MNKEGESEPLTTEQAILAKNPFEVPGKVEKPTLTDWDKDHVDLEWKAPNDGGAPIEEYVIEKKDKHGRWEEVGTGGSLNKQNFRQWLCQLELPPPK